MAENRTDRIALPLLQPGQAQKEMTHNEALARLDIAVQASVEGHGDDMPPADPEPGQCWIVGTAPEGAWSGHPGAIAGWTAAGWRFVAPREGVRAWVAATAQFALFAGGVWTFGEAHGRLIVEGLQVVGARGDAIADPAGGTMIDDEARAAIAGILAALRNHGLVEMP